MKFTVSIDQYGNIFGRQAFITEEMNKKQKLQIEILKTKAELRKLEKRFEENLDVAVADEQKAVVKLLTQLNED